jgi:hypothetical protein
MAKKPNYDFERRERDRLKAAKTAAKAAAKLEQRQRQRDAEPGAPAAPAEED